MPENGTKCSCRAFRERPLELQNLPSGVCLQIARSGIWVVTAALPSWSLAAVCDPPHDFRFGAIGDIGIQALIADGRPYEQSHVDRDNACVIRSACPCFTVDLSMNHGERHSTYPPYLDDLCTTPGRHAIFCNQRC